MGIHIGDNNKMKNVTIIEKNNGNIEPKEKKFPLFQTILAGVCVGVILLFSFWEDLVSFIENLGGG